MRFVLLVLLTLFSMLEPVQVAATSKMNAAVKGAPLAVFLALGTGCLALLAVAASGVMGRGHPQQALTAPWWAWTGGIMTAAILTLQMLALARVGAGAAVALSVAGQLAASLIVDHFGWLDVEKAPINGWRIAGLVLMVGGTVLMQKK